MKNIKKKIITIIIIILAICQITNKVNGYTRDEVINIIDYQVIEDDENSEDVDYDVLV